MTIYNALFGVLVFAAAAIPTVYSQTLPLESGAGFEWERVGNTPQFGSYDDIHFDSGGTIWTTRDVRWLNPVTNEWVEPTHIGQTAVLTLGPHPPGGPARADTVLTSIGTQRSTDGGVTWSEPSPIGGRALAEIPSGHPYAGRLLVGHNAGFSDDRGATWMLATYESDSAIVGETGALFSLPPPSLLPGVASGRDPAAPPDWPSGRILHSGYRGIAPSDDGGVSYQNWTWGAGPGYKGYHLAIVRRPNTHPLGPGPRILMTAVVSGEPAVSFWSSDDGAQTWQRRGFLPEPHTAPGYGRTLGIFALPEPGESDPGAGGRALIVMGLGHLYQTSDAGETWAVVGRAPEMVATNPPTSGTFLGAAEMGPDGRLYVAVSALGHSTGWVWRTAEAFSVGQVEAPPTADDFAVLVRPNPSGGEAEAVMELSRPSAVRVVVLDVLGREMAVVADGAVGAGVHVLRLPASLAPGTYFVRVEVERTRMLTRTITVVR